MTIQVLLADDQTLVRAGLRGLLEHTAHHFSTNFELYSHFVAFLKILCFSNTRFDGHNVAVIFGKQASLPLGFADPNMYRNHSPAIRHDS